MSEVHIASQEKASLCGLSTTDMKVTRPLRSKLVAKYKKKLKTDLLVFN